MFVGVGGFFLSVLIEEGFELIYVLKVFVTINYTEREIKIYIYFLIIHCKNSFGINSNYLSLSRSHYTVQNKGDLNNFMKLRLRFLSL